MDLRDVLPLWGRNKSLNKHIKIINNKPIKVNINIEKAS